MATQAARKSTVYRIPEKTERRKADRRRTSAYRLSPDLDPIQLIEDAKAVFYKDPNVIGVGIGERRQAGITHAADIVLIAYVKEKLAEDVVREDFLIPASFQDMVTDVVAPFGPDAPQEAVGFIEGHQLSTDMTYVDWPRLHEQWLQEAGGNVAFNGTVQDIGNVCVIEDDGTLIRTINGQQVIDYVRAFQLFRTTHADVYDFATFFTDSTTEMPPQGAASWYRPVFNDTQGIGFGPFDQRAFYGSDVLQGIMFLNQGHFPLWRYAMLQQQQHRWGAFARYRDSQTGSNQNDHLLGGWGHWAVNFDDDKSPMDYDIYQWVEQEGDFERTALQSDERTFSNLDLYLMGLLVEQAVGEFYLLTDPEIISGNLFSAKQKTLDIENIIWAEGPRIPSVATSQKLFKNAFVVLTSDLGKVNELVNQVDDLRVRFEKDFHEATKTLGRVDTALNSAKEELNSIQGKDLGRGGYTNLNEDLVHKGQTLTLGREKLPATLGTNLASASYTDLQPRQARQPDLRITGTQFQSTINAGQTQRWFTHSWPVDILADWVIVPTTVVGSGPKLTWDVATERTTSGLTYWITVRNLANQTISYDARYSVLR